MNRQLQVLKYLTLDWLAAVLAWGLFFLLRKLNENPTISSHLSVIYDDKKFLLGIIIIPIFWLLLYMIGGTYRRIYRKSRLKELELSIVSVLIGVTILFFTLILNDKTQ